jgi:hypothetical protein
MLVMHGEPSAAAWFEAGRTIQRVWLTAEQQQVAMHPWTVLPFLALHPQCPTARALTETEQADIARLATGLRGVFDVAASHHPFFVFRLITSEHSTVRAPRRPWRAFAEVDSGL